MVAQRNSHDVPRCGQMSCSSFLECCIFLVFSLLICTKEIFSNDFSFFCCRVIAMLSLANTDVIIVLFA